MFPAEDNTLSKLATDSESRYKDRKDFKKENIVIAGTPALRIEDGQFDWPGIRVDLIRGDLQYSILLGCYTHDLVECRQRFPEAFSAFDQMLSTFRFLP